MSVHNIESNKQSGQVTVKINRVACELESLQQGIQLLEQAIIPILLPPVPSADSEGDKPSTPLEVPLAERISDLHSMASKLTRTVEDIYKRISI